MSVSHKLTEDGLTLTSTYQGPEGEAKTTVGWTNEDIAKKNYENAMRSFEELVPKLQKRLQDVKGTKRTSWLRKIGPLEVFMNLGPPTWWKPRLSIRRDELRFGWLRVAVAIRSAKRRVTP